MDILLTTFNRAKYLKPSLESLLESDIEGSSLWIYDDCSEQPQALQLIEDFVTPLSAKCKVNYKRNEVNLGCDKNITLSAREIIKNTGCEYIVVTDSDTIYHEDWLSFLKSQFKNKDLKDVAAISLFNTPNHKVTGKFDKDLNIKESLGGMTVAVKSSYFLEMDETTDTEGKPWFCWDWEVVNAATAKGEKLLCSNVSYVQHIGRFGAHSRGDGSWDTCQDFIGDE